MKRARASRRFGFTLIELLAVTAIICVMAGLITVAVLSAQESGRLGSCRNNLNQIYKVILQYGATYGGYMPAWWHERWVGELGLVGGKWGSSMDDVNPNIPVVWSNSSQMAQWIQDFSTLPVVDPVTGVPQLDGSGKQVYTTISRNYMLRTPSPIIVCKSDPVMYRSDQGCVVSYMGLAKYGWWHAGGGGTAYLRQRIMDSNGNTTGWGPPAATGVIRDGSNNIYEYHLMTEFSNYALRLLLTETDPGTWQYEPGSCG